MLMNNDGDDDGDDRWQGKADGWSYDGDGKRQGSDVRRLAMTIVRLDNEQ